jgi:hypothetical protein
LSYVPPTSSNPTVFSLITLKILAAILTKFFNLSNVYDTSYMLWYTREASTAVYVTNLPLLWPLLREWIPWLHNRTSANKSHTNSRTHNTLRHTTRSLKRGSRTLSVQAMKDLSAWKEARASPDDSATASVEQLSRVETGYKSGNESDVDLEKQTTHGFETNTGSSSTLVRSETKKTTLQKFLADDHEDRSMHIHRTVANPWGGHGAIHADITIEVAESSAGDAGTQIGDREFDTEEAGRAGRKVRIEGGPSHRPGPRY